MEMFVCRELAYANLEPTNEHARDCRHDPSTHLAFFNRVQKPTPAPTLHSLPNNPLPKLDQRIHNNIHPPKHILKRLAF